MLSLTAKAIHLDGQHSSVVGQFTTAGGSIGRDAKCDMTLPDPDRRISRLQARIIYTGGQYSVRNASTSNPMYVNGVELSPGSSQAILRGDELRAGSYVITVAESADEGQASNSQPIESTLVGASQSQATDFPLQTSQAVPIDLNSDVDPLLALGSNGGQSGLTGGSPFADLLPEKAPVGNNPVPVKPELEGTDYPSSSATTGKVVFESAPLESAKQKPAAQSQSVNAPLQSRHNLDLDTEQKSLPGTERTNPVALNSEGQHPPVQVFDALNPLPAQGADARNQSSKDWTPPLSALAGDPFADLMGPPVETHIARVPVSGNGNGNTSQRASYIPDDFNPLATGGVAQRNSSDPLAELGRNARGLADVMPERTIDSIYDPSAESASTLAVDPLNESRERALRVEQSTDPMKLFSGNEQGVNALLGNNQINNGKSSMSDHASEMVSYFRAPTAKFDPAMQEQAGKASSSDIPAIQQVQPPVGSNSLSQQIPVQEASPAAQTQAAAPQPAPAANDLQPTHTIAPVSVASTLERSMIQEAPVAKLNLNNAANSAAQVSNVTASPTNVTRLVVKPPPGSKDSNTGNTEALISAFKRGAGLQDWPEQLITPELMETIGRMLQVTVQGLVSLLATRATVKQEIHLSVTLINPKANNPLKFLPDGHTALLQMLGPRMPGFMAPVDAIEEAVEDLVTHQTAIAAGTQAAITALFQRFDPDAIESQNPQNGVSEKISHTRHDARLWNTYKTQYRLIRDEVRDDFFKRLGADFHEAYNREYGNDESDRR